MKSPLIEKYRVTKFSEIKGQDNVIEEIITFMKMFPKKKAIILTGPVGTGKTSIALATAKEYDLEIFELNASDLRNRAKLDEILKPASQQKSLFKKSKLILMDEADGITTTDYGGLPELVALIEKTSFPMIITANDIYDKKFSLLRQKCKIINVKELKTEVIEEIINKILEKENKKLKPETIKLICKNSKGDVRAALNDLQTIILLGENIVVSAIKGQETVEKQKQEFTLSEREKQESIFNVLKKIFQNPTSEDIIDAYDNVDMSLDEILLWLEENIPEIYKGKSLAKAFNSLSKADLFKGRIYRQQHWRFLVYQNFFMSAGISSATKLKYPNKFIPYKKPSRILKIWMSNQKNAKKKSIIAKYAKFTHMSKKKAMKEAQLLPLIITKDMHKKMELDEKEIEYLEDKKGALIISNNLNRFREGLISSI